MTPVEKRQAEDAEFERKRRRSLEFLAIDMLAEEYGQADWQRFRAQDPCAFFRAKVEVLAAPPCFRVEVLDGFRGPPDSISYRFDWFAGERRRLDYSVSAYLLHEARDPEGMLAAAMRQVARQIESDSGAEVRFRIRSNRAAHEEALASIAAQSFQETV